MGLSGCYAMMKYLVLFVNLIFWVSGMFYFQSLTYAAGLRSETTLLMITNKILLGSAQRCWNLLSGIN